MILISKDIMVRIVMVFLVHKIINSIAKIRINSIYNSGYLKEIMI